MATINRTHAGKLNAIYQAFKPYLSHDQLMHALICWEDKYSQGSTFSVRYYIAEIHKSIANNVQARTLHVSLVTELARGTNNGDHSAGPLVESYRSKFNLNSVRPKYSLPETDAFVCLLEKLLTSIEMRFRNRVLSEFKMHVNQMKIEIELRSNVLAWLDDHKREIRIREVKTFDLRTLTTAFYSVCCSHIGPVETDRLFSKTLQQLTTNGGAIYAETFKKLL